MNEIILEYLRVFLTWPPIFLCLSILFYRKFSLEISRLLSRLKTLPGGIDFSDSQAARIETESTANQLPAGQSTNHEVATSAAEAERATQLLWEFRYLNYYLVHSTQSVLDWLVGFGKPVAATFYDSHWMPMIPDPRERNAIIAALANHHLVNLEPNNLISVTPKGIQYQDWRGPLPTSVNGMINVPLPKISTAAIGKTE